MNRHGYKYRGRKFHVSNVQAVLRNTAYVGVAVYNKTDSKTGERRDESEWIPIPVPALISPEDFETVQSRLVERRPTNRAARETTTNNLLDAAEMRLRRRWLRRGHDCIYRQEWAVSVLRLLKPRPSRADSLQGAADRRSKLDNIVLDALETKLLNPERLRDLLSGWLDHSAHAVDVRREKLRQLGLARRTSKPGSTGSWTC